MDSPRRARLAAITLGLMASIAPNLAGAQDALRMDTQLKRQVVARLKTIETAASGPVAVLDTNFMQHNVNMVSCTVDFLGVQNRLKGKNPSVRTVRVFQDGILRPVPT